VKPSALLNPTIKIHAVAKPFLQRGNLSACQICFVTLVLLTVTLVLLIVTLVLLTVTLVLLTVTLVLLTVTLVLLMVSWHRYIIYY